MFNLTLLRSVVDQFSKSFPFVTRVASLAPSAPPRGRLVASLDRLLNMKH